MFSVLCRRALVDPDDNALSLVDVLERVAVTPDAAMVPPTRGEALPQVPLQAVLVSLWRRSDDDIPELFRARIDIDAEIAGPSSQHILASESDVDLRSRVSCRTIARLGALPFHGPGLYWFVVSRMGDGSDPDGIVARVPLQIALATAMPTPTLV